MESKNDIIKNSVGVYRSLAKIPILNSAEILHSDTEIVSIISKWSQRNLEKGEITKFQRYHVLRSSQILFQGDPNDITTEQMSKFSPSGRFSCKVREVKEENKKKQFLEIWKDNGISKNFDIKAFDIHGDIYCDGEFGSLEWSHSENKIAYIAEKKDKKREPFYKQKSEESIEQTVENVLQGEEYTYKPDWGEQLVNKHQSVVVVCDRREETLKVLEGIPENFCPGQLLWSRDEKYLYGVAVESEPRRLGLIYCSSRKGCIFQLSLNGEFKILSDEDKSVRSPRLSLDGQTLYWLQRPSGGAHGGCQELVKFDLASKKKEILVEIVRTFNKNFSGLFLHNFPTRCFSNDGYKLFFTSYNGSRSLSYYLDLVTKKVHLIETGDGSASILDVYDDMVLISSASLQRPPCLKLSMSTSQFKWISVTHSETVCKDSFVKETVYESKNTADSFRYYNAIYYGPNPSESKIPLIVYPHGGPHSVSTNDYALEANFFVSLGYGVLMVNYRGSTGAGQDGVEFLLGRISDTDVKDNQEAVEDFLKNFSFLDSKNVFLYGKSHGGYLVGQLSAQYPDFYRAVVSLNPVTDVFAMYTMSDIPDWASSECGFSFDESKPLTIEQANKMFVTSPVQLADKIKIPTLLLIGRNDLRVPFYEGIRMYNALKARKLKVRLNLYEDNHTLGSVPNHFDCTINSALWFWENKAATQMLI